MEARTPSSKALSIATLLYITLESLIQHIQVASYMKYAPHNNGDDWNDEVHSMFSTLSYIALRLSAEGYLSLFVLASVIVTVTLVAYTLLYEKILLWNKEPHSYQRRLITGIDHVVYGVGLIPLVSQFISTQYCNTEKNMQHLDDLDCWSIGHIIILQIGFLFIGLSLLIAGAIAPVLRDERGGYESRVRSSVYFPIAYYTYLIAVALILGPIRIPKVGICVTAVLIVYFFIYSSYKYLHVASLKMGVLFGFLWLFISADIAGYDQDIGSQLVFGWPGAVVLGYLVFPVRALFNRPRDPVIVPVLPKLGNIKS